jgi:succinate-acetate transporter protein
MTDLHPVSGLQPTHQTNVTDSADAVGDNRLDTRTSHATLFGDRNAHHAYADVADGFPSTHIFLQPIATPQALGLAAWASSTFIFSTYLADWYGNPATGPQLWPFILAFGGFGQFAAGMWSFRSRDTLSSVIHTMWGSYWLALGIYYAFTAFSLSTNPLPERWSNIESFAIWQVPLAAFTWAAAIASLFRDWTFMTITGTMAIGSTITIIGWFVPSTALIKIAAYFWIVSSVIMWYRVLVHFMTETTGKENLLPLHRHPNNKDHLRNGFTVPYREPGVISGYYSQ